MKFIMSQNCEVCMPLTDVRRIVVENNQIMVYTKDDHICIYGKFRRKETATAALVGLMNDLEYEAWARVIPDKKETDE